MTVEQIKASLGIKRFQYDHDQHVNPLDVARAYAFHHHAGPNSYASAAIDSVLKARLSFSSEFNCMHDLMKRFVRVACPACGAVLEAKDSGGNCDSYTTRYGCSCGVVVSLTLPHDGMSVRFQEKQ